MRVLSRWTWAGVGLLAASVAAATACGPSVTVEPCACSGGAGGIAAGSTGGAPSTTGMGGLCGNGIVEPSDHCDDPTSAFYCPADCKPGTTVSAGTGGGCIEQGYYAGMLDGAPPVWAKLPESGGDTGLAAGDAACVALGIGADHVCDYEEVLSADAQGELSGIAQGTTAWVQRTTTALVNGVPSAPGPGGNCNRWTFPGNYLADGEYVTFDQAGVPTYHLDNDTIFDVEAPLVHEIPGDLQCGGTTRSILCCYPVCP